MTIGHRLPVAVFGALLALGCGAADDEPAGAGASGGAGGSSSAGAPGNGGTAGAGTGGVAAGQSGSSSTSGGSGASAGSGGGAEAPQVGVCGQRGESTVSDTEFEGYEELYLLGEEGFGDELCVVRIDVARTGDAPDGCTDCVWSHQVEFSNATVVVDTDGACAKSDLGFDAARLAAVDGSSAGYGYVFEFMGHNDVLMKYDAGAALWNPFGNAVWDEETSEFHFDHRDGFCNY